LSLDSLPDVHCEFQRTHDLSNSQEKFPDFQFIHDDVLVTGTSRFRPDFHIDLHTHVLIIECDQKAHAGRHTHLSYTLESGYAPFLLAIRSTPWTPNALRSLPLTSVTSVHSLSFDSTPINIWIGEGGGIQVASETKRAQHTSQNGNHVLPC